MTRRIVIGIGGNVGSGKTTVARYFQQKGARYLSADRIGKAVIPLISQHLKKRFGKSIMIASKISHKKLRNVVFTNRKNLKFLNQLSHPILTRNIINSINRFKNGILVIDAALLFDWPKVLRKLDYAILVSSPRILSEKRAGTNGIDKRTFWYIIKIQKKEKVMARHAHYIIKNDGGLKKLKKRCCEVFQEIIDGH